MVSTRTRLTFWPVDGDETRLHVMAIDSAGNVSGWQEVDRVKLPDPPFRLFGGCQISAMPAAGASWVMLSAIGLVALRGRRCRRRLGSRKAKVR